MMCGARLKSVGLCMFLGVLAAGFPASAAAQESGGRGSGGAIPSNAPETKTVAALSVEGLDVSIDGAV